MTDGGVLVKWKDYRIYFDVQQTRTAKQRLSALGIKIPKAGAPTLRREVLDMKVDEKSKKFL